MNFWQNSFRQNRILILICSFIFISQLSAIGADITQTIRGRVVDRDSKTALPGANIIILNTDPLLGTSTNSEGMFEIINVPIGRHDLKISFIGYQPAFISNIMVGSGKEIVLNIELNEAVVSTKEVVVKAVLAKDQPIDEMASVSARTFSVEETGRYAASINDPARMALSFAGVSTGTSDAQNMIIVRGNSPRGMLWQIEGIPVSNPNHFSEEGVSGGAVCMISNNMLDNSDFLIGAWPAGFGNALSGIFDINFRQGNTHSYEHAFQFSSLGVDFSSEGPLSFSDGASYLVNYRYSTLAILSAAGINIVDKSKGRPDYQDLSYKVFIPTKKFGSFSIWGIGGLSSSISESETAKGLTFDNKEYVYLEEEGEEANSDVGIVGLTHTYLPDNSSYIKSALSFNAERLQYSEDGLIDNVVEEINRTEFLRNQLLFSTYYNRKVSSAFTYKAGLIINHMNYNSEACEYNEDRNSFDQNVNASGSSNLFQAYIQSRYSFNEYVSLFAGLHSMYFMLNDSYSIEPRAAVRWNINEKRSVTLGYGLHSQMQPLSLYMAAGRNNSGINSYSNQNLDFSKASHVAVSYDELLNSNWRLKLELYYQHLFDIPIAKDTTDNNFNADFLRSYSVINSVSSLDYLELDNKGTAKNYGVELTIEKFFGEGWYFLSTTSLYQAKYKAFDGIERDTRFNGNYVFNLLAGKEYNFDSNKILGINVRVIKAGGKRENPVMTPRPLFDNSGNPVIDPVTGNQVIEAPDDYEKAFAKQLDDYFRIDLGISFRMNFSTSAHIISFDIQNVLNRENVRKIDEYDVEKKKYIYKYQAGLIPAFNYRIEF